MIISVFGLLMFVYVCLTVDISKQNLYPIYKSFIILFVHSNVCPCFSLNPSMYDCINYLHTIIPFTYDGISTKNMGVFFLLFSITAPHRTSYNIFLYIKKRKAFPFSSMICLVSPFFFVTFHFKCDINTEFSYLIFYFFLCCCWGFLFFFNIYLCC